jgi:basic membrane protein A
VNPHSSAWHHRLVLCLAASALSLVIVAGCEKKDLRPRQPIAAQDIKIGVLYMADPDRETSGFTYEHQAGIRAMQKALGLTDEQILIGRNVPETDFAEEERRLREFAAAGVNIVFATSDGYDDASVKAAAEYPGIVFSTLAGLHRNATNLTNYYGAIHQARYLSGIVAGLQTKTNKIGYVAAMGMENSEVTSGLNAFALGVESVNPDARILVHVTHNWSDPAGEALATRILIERGSDIVTHHTDTPTPIREAQKAGVLGIGYNSDMRREAPDIVLTSVVWHWEAYYTALAQSVIDGSFTTAPSFMGIKDGLCGLSPLNSKLIAPGTREALARATARIGDDSGIFDGVMETNDGRLIGQADGKLSPRDIVHNITWYYRNIVEIHTAAPGAAPLPPHSAYFQQAAPS